jgi:hypothetical protein
MSLGMAAGSFVISLLYPAPPLLERPRDYLTSGASGVLWAMGNYGMLLLADRIGTGRGFAVAQLNIIVNASLGIYLFKDPRRRPALRAWLWRAAWWPRPEGSSWGWGSRLRLRIDAPPAPGPGGLSSATGLRRTRRGFPPR